MIDTHYVSELFISDMVVSCGIRLFSGILVGFYHNEGEWINRQKLKILCYLNYMKYLSWF